MWQTKSFDLFCYHSSANVILFCFRRTKTKYNLKWIKLNLFSRLELPLAPFLKILTLHLCGVSVVTTMQETRFLDHGKWISICVFSFLMDKSRMLTVPVFSALGIEVFIFWTRFLRISTLICIFFDSVQISPKTEQCFGSNDCLVWRFFCFYRKLCSTVWALHSLKSDPTIRSDARPATWILCGHLGEHA